MGVSGCGKSTVAQSLAQRTGGVYLDADDFHSAANKAKMAAGIPLVDADRWDWLDALNEELKRREADPHPIFLACSALRQIYRDRLAHDLPTLEFIYLRGSRELIAQRLQARSAHFMPPALLDSQFATLEEPAEALAVDIGAPVDDVVAEIIRRRFSAAN
jgi:carbohydrate kinase (thermoresistant glucokinase family)